MLNFKNWLLVNEENSEKSDVNQLKNDMTDLLADLDYIESSFDKMNPTKRWAQKAASAIRVARNKLGDLKMQDFINLNSTSPYDIKFLPYGTWKNIMPKPPEGDTENQKLFDEIEKAVNLLNTTKATDYIYPEKLEDIKKLIQTGNLVREVEINGVKTNVKSFMGMGKERKPAYIINKAIHDFKILLPKIDKANTEIKTQKKEDKAREKEEIKVQASAEANRIGDANTLVKLTQKLEEMLSSLEEKFTEEKYNLWLNNYKLLSDGKINPDDAKKQTWYKYIVGKSEQETKKEIKRIFNGIKIAFMHRIVSKLGPIVQAKKTLHGADFDMIPKYVSVDGPSIWADLLIKFTDNSSLSVRQKSVLKESVLGNLFYQFPTTFHAVTFPDGRELKSPSEKSVYVDFANTIVPQDVDIEVKE